MIQLRKPFYFWGRRQSKAMLTKWGAGLMEGLCRELGNPCAENYSLDVGEESHPVLLTLAE
jgi:hypothetical protein